MNGRHLKREDALEVLRRHKEEFEFRYGVTKLGVFGSVARDEATEESDVDVVVRLREPKLFRIVNIKEDLEAGLASPFAMSGDGRIPLSKHFRLKHFVARAFAPVVGS